MRQSSKLPAFDRATLALLFLFLLSDVMGGAIRYFAVRLHVVWLPYAPSLLLAFSLLPMFFVYLATEGVTSAYLIIFGLFGVAATYGVFNLGNAKQVEFGLWTLVPFLYGVVALPAILRGWRRLTPYATLLWALAVAGVIINVFYSWPWIGMEYQVGTATVTASRQWTLGVVDLSRLPGFSEASFFVAPQILFLALYLRETLRRRWRVLVWVVSGIAITLTTSKTPLTIFLIFSILWIFSRGSVRRSWRLIPIAAACADIALPFSTLFVRRDWLESIASPVEGVLVGSFADRLQNGWPAWIRMIVAHGNVLLGRGLGGIGTAQAHFEPALFSPSDNIAVYLFATFGVFGLMVLIFFGYWVARARVRGPMESFFFFSGCAVLLTGTTLSVMDASVLGLVFGASFRYFQGEPTIALLHAPPQRKRGPAPLAVGDSGPSCV